MAKRKTIAQLENELLEVYKARGEGWDAATAARVKLSHARAQLAAVSEAAHAFHSQTTEYLEAKAALVVRAKELRDTMARNSEVFSRDNDNSKLEIAK